MNLSFVKSLTRLAFRSASPEQRFGPGLDLGDDEQTPHAHRRSIALSSKRRGAFSRKRVGAIVTALALFVGVGQAHAQQREIVNPSFEDGPTPSNFVIGPDSDHPGWNSTNGEIETWADGFQNRDAQQSGSIRKFVFSMVSRWRGIFTTRQEPRALRRPIKPLSIGLSTRQAALSRR